MTNYCTNFQKNHRKIVGGVCDKKLLEFNTYLEKMEKFLGDIIFKPGGNDNSILCVAKPHFHVLQILVNFQQNPRKTVGVCDTKLLVFCTQMDTWSNRNL